MGDAKSSASAILRSVLPTAVGPLITMRNGFLSDPDTKRIMFNYECVLLGFAIFDS